MALPSGFGIKAFGDDGFLRLHSDYSSIVYEGEATKVTNEGVYVTYNGDHSIAISDEVAVSNYGLGKFIQYEYTTNGSSIIPFYKPSSSGQRIVIADMSRVLNTNDPANNGTYKWVINVYYADSSPPNIYIFCPAADLTNTEMFADNDYGLFAYNDESKVVYSSSRKTLKIDDIVGITYSSLIKNDSKGNCSSAGCHVNFLPTETTTIQGTVTHTTDTIYHCITSAYGGLAYKNEATGDQCCKRWLGACVKRKGWSSYYGSWSSFRACISVEHGTNTYTVGWLGDVGGAYYQLLYGKCGWAISGLAGIIIGGVVGIFTGGLGLAALGAGVIGGLAAVALSEEISAPSFPVYNQDEVADTTNPNFLLSTKLSYYQ